MFALQPVCEDTVSLLTALFLGADGACVDLSGRSLIFAMALFVVVVFLLQRLANRLFGKAAKSKAEAGPASGMGGLRSGQVSTHLRQELR